MEFIKPENENLLFVLNNFYDCKATTITQITNGTANILYTVVCSDQKYVLRKRNERYSEDTWILFEIEYLHRLKDSNLPVPVPIKSRDGQYRVIFESGVYRLYPYIAGNRYNFDSPKELKESGSFLAKMHNALSGFEPKTKKLVPRFDNPEEMSVILNKYIKNMPVTDQKNKDIITHLAKMIDLISKSFTDKQYNCLPKTVIHGDYHPANVKYYNEKICGVFDFDWISIQPRLSDVVDGIMYFASYRYETLKGEDILSLVEGYEFNLERTKLFLDSYMKTINLPLTKQEIVELPWFIKARLINNRVDALRKIPLNKTVEMLTVGIIEKLEWVDRNIEEIQIYLEKLI